jgi:hypothetical protein
MVVDAILSCIVTSRDLCHRQLRVKFSLFEPEVFFRICFTQLSLAIESIDILSKFTAITVLSRLPAA